MRNETIYVTLPPPMTQQGSIHPISKTIEEMVSIFGTIGFKVEGLPNIETDWYNFSALNTPEHHPSRSDHDTFYLPANPKLNVKSVLRTQISGVQIRTMLKQKPPIRAIIPGSTYRADDDATHSPMFHQCEGLVIDKNITLGNLKYCLTVFLQKYFNVKKLPLCFRTSYFPFTKLSLEIDIGWSRITGEISDNGEWLETTSIGSSPYKPTMLREN